MEKSTGCASERRHHHRWPGRCCPPARNGKSSAVAEDGSVLEDADNITADEPPEAPATEDIADDNALQDAESAPVVIAEDAGLPAEDMPKQNKS